jgi:arylsulfatase A-like enzyme
VARAVWLGLVSAWLELGVIFGHREVVGTVTRVTVRLNWYHVSLGLLGHLAVFLPWLVLAGIARRAQGFRGRMSRVVEILGLFLGLVSPLLAVEGLHGLGAIVLAAGLAIRLGPWLERRGEAIVSWTIRPLALTSAALGVASFAWVHSAEARHLAALPPAPSGAKNVLLVVLDTVRADHLGLYGYNRPTTPHLDALGRTAITFDFARATAPWTLPSHASMFTGHWPHQLSVDTDRPLDGSAATLAEFFAHHGYATAGFVGNAFYCSAWFGIDRGFGRYVAAVEDRAISLQEALRCAAIGRRLMPLAVRAGLWDASRDAARNRTAQEVNRDALAWLDEGGGRPFFLFLNYYDAHSPYTVPPGYPLRFSRASRKEVFDVNRRAFEAQGKRLRSGRLTDEGRAVSANLARLGPDAYDDCIRYLDEQLALLLGELKRRGLDRETWVIITADHGEHFGEHDFFWHGSSLYRPVIDVPLLIVPPSRAEARRIEAPVSLRDLPATVVDLVGLGASSPFPGRSLRRHWAGSRGAVESGPGDIPLSEVKLTDDAPGARRFRRAMVDDGYIYHHDPRGAEELYSLADRAEATNLAPRSESAATLERFRTRTEPGVLNGP